MLRTCWLALMLLCGALSPSVMAAAPSIDLYLRPPAFRDPTPSPNGRYFAVTVPYKDRMNLAVVDVESRKANLLTSFDDFDVVDVHWVGNDRLVFSLGRINTPTGPDSQDAGGLFMTSRDGREARKLAPTVREMIRTLQIAYRSLDYLAPVEGSDEEILATQWDAGSEGVFRVNVRTGAKEHITFGRPERIHSWVLDRHAVPRVAVASIKDSVQEIVWFRESGDSPWVELLRNERTHDVIVPLAFDDDNRTLIVASNRGRDTMALFTFDPKTRRLGEMLAGHPRFDIGANELGSRILGIVLHPRTRQLLGFRIDGPKPQAIWIDERYERIQRTIDAALPGMVNQFSRDIDGTKLVVSSYGDRQPVRWYFLHLDRMALEPLFESRPWLNGTHLVEMQPFFFRTRDGLELLGYRFLPADYKPGQKLPTVVHIHGGPHARADRWGYGSFGTIEAQLLASRGYAVVVPNFRITPGFGAKVFSAGMRQMGKAMQEDIEDATDWAVAQGFVDADRICLSGASYGGYASLMGVAKTPDKYRCAIAGLAVTDLALLMTSNEGVIPSNRTGGLQFWYRLAGNPDNEADRAAMRAVSPAFLASRIKAPILMYSGVDDYIVPLEQPKKMRAALAAEGHSVRWISKDDEAHGFGKLANNVDLYNEVLDFLDQNIGSPKPAK